MNNELEEVVWPDRRQCPGICHKRGGGGGTAVRISALTADIQSSYNLGTSHMHHHLRQLAQ
jgi:hypothetical protein